MPSRRDAVVHDETVEVIAPAVGAVVGTLICELAAERFGIRRELMGFGALGAGLLVSARTQGIWRNGASGLIAAGASMVAVEILRRLVGPSLRRQPAPSESITRKAVQEALARIGSRSSHSPLQQEFVPTVARSDRQQQHPAAESGQDHVAAVSVRLDRDERATLEGLRMTTSAPARPPAVELSKERLVEILGKLRPDERIVVARKLDQVGSDVFERIMRYVGGLSVDEAAAWTRSYFPEQPKPNNNHALGPNGHAS
jgi:hypothetical protein